MRLDLFKIFRYKYTDDSAESNAEEERNGK